MATSDDRDESHAQRTDSENRRRLDPRQETLVAPPVTAPETMVAPPGIPAGAMRWTGPAVAAHAGAAPAEASARAAMAGRPARHLSRRRFLVATAGLVAAAATATAGGLIYRRQRDDEGAAAALPPGIRTIAGGSLKAEYLDGPVADARFGDIGEIVGGGEGLLYVVDDHPETEGFRMRRLRKIRLGADVSTVASVRVPVRTKSGYPNYSYTIAGDAHDNLWVTAGLEILAISPKGMSSLVAGGESAWGYRDGPARTALFRDPEGLVIDRAGTLYIADTWNHRIRKLTADGQVSTVAGTTAGAAPMGGYRDGPAAEAQFSGLEGLAVDASGTLYVADTDNRRIRRIGRDGIVTTVAGSGNDATTDGPAAQAAFRAPRGIAVAPDGSVYITETYVGAGALRKIRPDGIVETIVPLIEGFFPRGITVDATGSVYVTDLASRAVLAIDAR
jgi:sugar lactone lactonase YvrE